MSRRPFLERTLFPVIMRQPRLGLALADVAQRAAYRLNLSAVREAITPAEDWEKLLGPCSPARLAEIQYLQARNVFRTRLLEKFLKRAKPEQAGSLWRWEHFDRLRKPVAEGRPVIIALWHVGPLFAALLGLIALERPLTMFLHRPVSGFFPDDCELLYTEAGKSAGMLAFRKAVARLKEGRPLVIAADVFGAREYSLPARVFGLDLRIVRGFAALSRVSGALVIPVSIRWEGLSTLVYDALPPLESSFGDRSDRDEFEQAMIDEYVAILEEYMKQKPYALDPVRVGLFINAWQRAGAEPTESMGDVIHKAPA